MIEESVFLISTESPIYTNIFLEYVSLLSALLYFFRELLFPILFLPNISYIVPIFTASLDKLIALLISFIELFILIVAIVFIIWLISWFFSESRRIEILPFKVPNDFENYDEKTIPQCLVVEYRRILETHRATNKTFKHNSDKGKTLLPHKNDPPVNASANDILNSGTGPKMAGILVSETVLPVIDMSLSSECIETEISSIGSISIAGVSIPLGELILILKQMRKSQRSNPYITGSLQRSGSEIYLTALMGGRKQYSWQLNDKGIYYGEDNINNLIKNLAFRIIYDLSVEQASSTDVTELRAKTWEGFRYYTEAIDSYFLYMNTAKLKYLGNSRKSCIEGLKIEKEYPPIFKLLYSLGVECSNKGYYSLSEDVFRQCIDIRPHEVKTYNALSSVLANHSLYNEALEAADEAIEKLDTYIKKVWLVRVYVLSKLGRNEAALEGLCQYTNLRFKEKKAYCALSVLINFGYSKEALEAVDKAVEKLKIDLHNVWLNGSLALINLNHNIEALEAADGAIEELKTDLATALFNKSFALANLGEYKEALEAADKATTINPNFCLAWSNKSFLLTKLGEYKKALDAAEEATKLDSSLSMAWLNKSLAYANLDHNEEGLDAADKATELSPNLAMAWSNKSFFLANLGRYEEALNAANKATKINPNFAMAWLNKSLAYANLSRNEEGLDAADKATELNPNFAMAWLNKSFFLANLGRNVEALEAADRVIKLSHHYHAEAWLNKSIALDNLGKWEEALDAADRATELSPNLAEAWVIKIILLASLSYSEEALDAADRAIKLNPNLFMAWLYKSFALDNLGLHKEAWEAEDRAMKLAKNAKKDIFL